MADEKKQKAAAPKRDRQADIERMAADVFVRRFCEASGNKTPESIAAAAFDAARVFYKVCDEIPPG